MKKRMRLLELECGHDDSSDESRDASEDSNDLNMINDETDTKGVEHQKVYDVRDRQLEDNADDMDAAAYLQHLEQMKIESKKMEKEESAKLQQKGVERRKTQRERNKMSSDADDVRDTPFDFKNGVLGNGMIQDGLQDGMQCEEPQLKISEPGNYGVDNESDCREGQKETCIDDVYSDESELYIESDDSEDEPVAEAVDRCAAYGCATALRFLYI